jgi:hypothetical protein
LNSEKSLLDEVGVLPSCSFDIEIDPFGETLNDQFIVPWNESATALLDAFECSPLDLSVAGSVEE